MAEKRTSDEAFFERYQALDNESVEDFLLRWSSTESELRETIDFLIGHRQALRDCELERLEAESEKLLQQVKGLELEKLLEELRCFKEILSLQKRLLREKRR